MSRSYRWLLGILMVAALITAVANLGKWDNFVVLVRRSQPLWLAVALLLQVSTYPSLALGWRAVLEAGDKRRFAMRPLLRIALSKLFADQALPTAGMGGNVLLVDRLRAVGASRATAMAVLLISIHGYYAAYVVLALTSLLLLWLHGQAGALLVGLVTTFVLVALSIPALALWLRKHGSRPLPERLERLGPVRQLLRSVAEAPARLLSDRGLLLRVAWCNALVFAADILTLYACLRGLGVELALSTALIAFTLASIVVTLGPIPFGLGSFEAAGTSALHLLGVPFEAALSGVFLLRFLTLWLPLVPGFLELRHLAVRSPDQGNVAGAERPRTPR